jgi:hypothetical protein
MNATLADYFNEIPKLETQGEPQAPRPKTLSKHKTLRPETDIRLWLMTNAPLTFQELVDIRYCLYHGCSRAGYTVKRLDDDKLMLTGRHGSLQIISNKARRFLLWQLRILAREKRWRGALPGRKAFVPPLS